MECPSKHHDATELTIAYIEGSLDSVAQVAFQRHLQTCGRCRELMQAQQELWAALDSWTPLPISSDFDERLYRRIAAEKTATPKWWQRFITAPWSGWPAVPLVATACVALIAVVLLRGPGLEPARTGNASTQPHGPAIEQVESALQDIEMLKQLGPPSNSKGTPEKM